MQNPEGIGMTFSRDVKKKFVMSILLVLPISFLNLKT